MRFRLRAPDSPNAGEMPKSVNGRNLAFPGAFLPRFQMREGVGASRKGVGMVIGLPDWNVSSQRGEVPAGRHGCGTEFTR
jgi:hypothetical protein